MKQHSYLIILSAVLFFSSCKKKEDTPSPTLDFSFSNNKKFAPDTVSFHAITANANSVQWNFGDGQTGTGMDVKHIYAHIGYYTINATATGDGGSINRYRDINISPYSRVLITQIVGSFPATKPDGTTWDPEPGATAPDPYYRIYNSSGSIITPNAIYAANMITLAYNYAPSIAITDLGSNFKVSVYDYDSGASYDDLIGELSFLPSSYMTDTTANFPQSFIKNNGMGLSLNVKVTWAQ